MTREQAAQELQAFKGREDYFLRLRIWLQKLMGTKSFTRELILQLRGAPTIECKAFPFTSTHAHYQAAFDLAVQTGLIWEVASGIYKATY